MKKVFLPLFSLCLLLAGCETQEIEKPDLVDAGSFLTVRIMTDKASPATKADGPDYTQGNGEYLDGSPKENKISSAILFFFNATNEAQAIASDNGKNRSWFHIENFDDDESTGPNHNETVEKITVPITVRPEGETLPTQVLAVLNPTEGILKLKDSNPGPDLRTLLALVEDYEGCSTDFEQKLAKEGTFVMSNSVYYTKEEGSKTKVQTTRISEDNYYTLQELNTAESSSKEAVNELIKEHLVTIYVERVLARLDLSIDLYYDKGKTKKVEQITVNNETLYKIAQAPTPTNTGKNIEEDIDIYVKFCGWTIIDTPAKSRLIKEIDTSWGDDIFNNGEIWNSADYHRSFWALNPALESGDYKYGPYNQSKITDTWNKELLLNEKDLYSMPNQKNPTVTAYMQENAAPWDNTQDRQATKVVIAAQMVDEQGKPIDLYQWAGEKYTKYGIQMMVANCLENLFKKSGEDYTKIEPADIDIYKNPVENNEMITYAALSETGEDTQWYERIKEDGKISFKAISNEAANEYIKTQTEYNMGVNTINHWVDGYTYYYFTIRHFGKDDQSPAYYGVVRNHIYDAKVTSLSGFGAPEYNSGDKYNDDFLMSAEVRILSWRVVRQDYDLTW